MGEHNHEHCGNGCNHDHDNEHTIVTLTLDDGTELECSVLTIFPVGEKQYIALLPVEESDDEESEVFLYRFIQSDNDEMELLNIEDDEEYEAVADAFDEILDEQDFDEMYEDDDEE